MKMLCFWLGFALTGLPLITAYNVGVGRADVTGPAAEITFMGYAKSDQKGRGIHLRQFARAFIIDDGNQRILYVSTDCGMMGYGIRVQVLKNLKKKYGALYTEQNVILSGTHTHSTPAGFLRYLLFDISSFGFVQDTFVALVTGITNAIKIAHNNMVNANIYMTRGELLGANINRSPTAYLANPQEERDKYQYDVDKDMVQLRFVSADSNATPLGAIHWFAVHPTSMNNTNHLISSDNVGYASLLIEANMNKGALPGTGPFVGAFASTNLGDVSPNTRGPKCQKSGLPCDVASSTCKGLLDQCVASGPGKDMFESTQIIAQFLVDKALELWSDSNARKVMGDLKFIYQNVYMPNQTVNYTNPTTKEVETGRGCPGAMGYSFAAGTTDGPGVFFFEQGTTTDNPLWNLVRNFLHEPSKEQIKCQAPKPILLNTGEMKLPYAWQTNTVSTQVVQIGDFLIAAVPGEFTTMAGRRLRDEIKQAVLDNGGPNVDVVIAGLSNIYTDYITTPEEYDVQRYEGASTVYGRYTHAIYLAKYRELIKALAENKSLDPGPNPEYIERVLSLVPPVLFDVPCYGHHFGDCIQQPATTVHPGDTVVAKFVAGHPRNSVQTLLGATFLKVERNDGDNWTTIATDANWETKFIWGRKRTLLASSEATIMWEIPPNTQPGEYRIRHFGDYKFIFGGGIYSYKGTSNSFQVV